MHILFSIVVAVAGYSVVPQIDSSATPAESIVEFSRQCRLAAAQIWSRSLCGPLMLVDPRSRLVVASEADSAKVLQRQADGSFAGTLPQSVRVANTMLHWGGKDWAMVMLPLPTDPFSRLKLLAHESFHREERSLGFAYNDPVSPHLDQEEGRLWLRLELRAWSAALSAPAKERKSRVQDALAFRSMRYARFPGADSLESKMELHEGIAEYTGARVASDVLKASPEVLAKELLSFEKRETYVRSFAYATGPALGMMLDRFAPGWRKKIRISSSLAGVLEKALSFDRSKVNRESAVVRAGRYGYAALVAEETSREKERIARIAHFTQLFLEGPVVVLRQQNIGMSFNPGNLVPLGDRGTVYPTGTFTGPWGKIVITQNGALLSPDFRELRVPAPASADGERIDGPGWILELTSGWKLKQGNRKGDLEAANAN